MIDPNNLTPDELATLHEHGGLDVQAQIADSFTADYDADPGDDPMGSRRGGAASSSSRP